MATRTQIHKRRHKKRRSKNRRRSNQGFLRGVMILSGLFIISLAILAGVVIWMLNSDGTTIAEADDTFVAEPIVSAQPLHIIARVKAQAIDKKIRVCMMQNNASYSAEDVCVQQLLTDADTRVRAQMLVLLGKNAQNQEETPGKNIVLTADNFDYARYVSEHPELTNETDGTPDGYFRHFTKVGLGESYQAHSLNPDLEIILNGTSDEALASMQALLNPLRGYVVHSAFNFSNFDYERYRADNPEIADDDAEEFLLYEHMVHTGIPEGKEIHSTDPLIEEAINSTDEATKQNFLQELVNNYYTDNTTPFWDQITYTPEEEAAIIEWLSDSLFVGDSVMLGFSYFCEGNPDPFFGSLQFHTVASYSLREGVNEAGPDIFHPMFRGEMLPAWDVVPQLGTKKVFLFFGLNDMVFTPDVTATYMEIIRKIEAASPGVEIIIMSATVPYEGIGRLNGANITAFNEVMRCYAAQNGWEYIDVNYPLTDGNGKMLIEYTSDYYVHVEKSAYEVWGRLIKAYVYTKLYGPIDPERGAS